MLWLCVSEVGTAEDEAQAILALLLLLCVGVLLLMRLRGLPPGLSLS